MLMPLFNIFLFAVEEITEDRVRRYGEIMKAGVVECGPMSNGVTVMTIHFYLFILTHITQKIWK